MPALPPIDFDHPPAEPLAWFRLWFEEAKAAAARLGLPNPNAMTLSTIDGPPNDGRPSSRIVLMKSIDERDGGGVVFYTNRESRKGAALRAHPRAALLFHWDALDRQVRIEGGVTLVSDAESDAYFASRPRQSQVGAWASRQSREVGGGSRAELEAAVREIERRFEGKPVPRPPYWGGYRVAIEQIEFWQGCPARLHDRVVYTRGAGGKAGAWETKRLFP